MVQRPVRQAAKNAKIFIQQQQSATPYLAQQLHATQRHYPSDPHLDKRGEDGVLKPIDPMHYCALDPSYPTVVVAATTDPYHILSADEHSSYRDVNYIYEPSNYSSPYYSVSSFLKQKCDSVRGSCLSSN
jgi:hypothetical protein